MQPGQQIKNLVSSSGNVFAGVAYSWLLDTAHLPTSGPVIFSHIFPTYLPMDADVVMAIGWQRLYDTSSMPYDYSFTLDSINVFYDTIEALPVPLNAVARSDNEYRYSFNGKMKDNEWAGRAHHLDFGARLYDPRIGRWNSIDKLYSKAPGWTPYRFGFDNPIIYKDRDGNYETDGHFWTVYLMATMLKRTDAYDIAYHTESWDNYINRSGFNIGENPTWLNPIEQMNTHALTGGDADFERDVSSRMFLKAETYGQIGKALHRLGDSYAHTKIGGVKMYSPFYGHAFTGDGGHEPDKIRNRPGLYLEYVSQLNILMNGKFGGGNLDLFTFNYIANSGMGTEGNSAIFKTEIGILNGEKSLTFDGDQSNIISKYIEQRNSHYHTNIKTSTSTMLSGDGSRIITNVTIEN